MKKIILLLTSFLALALTGSAKVWLPSFFSDNMVLQQQTEAPLWGTAQARTKVTAKPSWTKQTYSTRSDDNGNWKLTLPTPEAGGPYTIVVSDGDKTTLRNVLIGEVWLCSGQSNMEMPVCGFDNQPVIGSGTDILHSTNPQIRLFTVARNPQAEPQADVTGEWSEATPKSVRDFSAVAYYFGRTLQQLTGVPVALIHSSWGGSGCETWMPDATAEAYGLRLPVTNADITNDNHTPTALYNGMIAPFAGMALRGVVWYQGEDNLNRYKDYALQFKAMVEGWRSEWKRDDFPFIYCQIAPFDYTLFEGSSGYHFPNSAYLREQQSIAERIISNAYMAVLTDIGTKIYIHCPDKHTVGERLCRLALNKVYGWEGLTAESPRYEGYEIKDGKIIVSFSHCAAGLHGKGYYGSKLFEIAGADSIFHPASAWVHANTVVVSSPDVPEPVAARYAFQHWAEGDLWCEDLPLPSFRTDDWNLPKDYPSDQGPYGAK